MLNQPKTEYHLPGREKEDGFKIIIMNPIHVVLIAAMYFAGSFLLMALAIRLITSLIDLVNGIPKINIRKAWSRAIR